MKIKTLDYRSEPGGEIEVSLNKYRGTPTTEPYFHWAGLADMNSAGYGFFLMERECPVSFHRMESLDEATIIKTALRTALSDVLVLVCHPSRERKMDNDEADMINEFCRKILNAGLRVIDIVEFDPVGQAKKGEDYHPFSLYATATALAEIAQGLDPGSTPLRTIEDYNPWMKQLHEREVNYTYTIEDDIPMEAFKNEFCPLDGEGYPRRMLLRRMYTNGIYFGEME